MSNSPEDLEQKLATKFEAQEEKEECRYLLFRLNNELYGTPLLGVREVVQPQKPQYVPNTVPHFKGLINVRGQVVGLVDLRSRFGYPMVETPKQALLVFETDSGPIAVTVDQVEAVTRVEDQEIHKKPNIQSQVPMEFLIGVTHYQNRMVTLIDLRKTFSQEEYTKVGQGKLMAA